MYPLAPLDPAGIFGLYQAARPRLPDPPRQGAAEPAADLSELADRFDLFLLDAFGVLNIGEQAIPGAAARIAALTGEGKRVMVITNAASYPKHHLIARYRGLGFDFGEDDVISSRETLLSAIPGQSVMRWGVMAEARWGLEELDHLNAVILRDDASEFDMAGGFLLLGSRTWSARQQAMLSRSLERKPRPVLVGNPDIVAPREGGFSFEPGHYAHELAAIDGIDPAFFGKPFGNVFAGALARSGANIPIDRILMVGDTLHTDILGGLAAGLRTALITETGSLHQGDVAGAIVTSGISPDYLLPRI